MNGCFLFYPPHLPQFQSPARSISSSTLQKRKEKTLETFLLKKEIKNPFPQSHLPQF